MGVWQMIESDQPYVGQWDAVTDSFWDGMCWVPATVSSFRNYENLLIDNYFSSISTITNIPKELWNSAEKFVSCVEESQKSRAWEALKSMF